VSAPLPASTDRECPDACWPRSHPRERRARVSGGIVTGPPRAVASRLRSSRSGSEAPCRVSTAVVGSGRVTSYSTAGRAARPRASALVGAEVHRLHRPPAAASPRPDPAPARRRQGRRIRRPLGDLRFPGLAPGARRATLDVVLGHRLALASRTTRTPPSRRPTRTALSGPAPSVPRRGGAHPWRSSAAGPGAQLGESETRDLGRRPRAGPRLLVVARDRDRPQLLRRRGHLDRVLARHHHVRSARRGRGGRAIGAMGRGASSAGERVTTRSFRAAATSYLESPSSATTPGRRGSPPRRTGATETPAIPSLCTAAGALAPVTSAEARSTTGGPGRPA